jgi:hypothetical protein
LVSYLAFSDRSESLDYRELDVEVWRIIQKLHHLLHHPRRRLLKLSMFLGEDEHLVVEKAPVTGVLANGDDGNQEAGGRSEIRSLLFNTTAVSLG